jgi:hypothetical protein
VTLEEGYNNRIQLKFSFVSDRMFDRQYELFITLQFDREAEAINVCDILSPLISKNESPVGKTAEIDFKLVAEQEKIYQFIETTKRREGAVVIEEFLEVRRQVGYVYICSITFKIMQ